MGDNTLNQVTDTHLSQQHIAQHTQVAPSRLAAAGLSASIMLLKRTLKPFEHVQRHSHSWGQVIYASQGVLSVITPAGRYIVPPEQAVWVPPFVDHEVIALGQVQLSSLYLDETRIGGFPPDSTCLSVKPVLQLLLQEANTLVKSEAGLIDPDFKDRVMRLLMVIRDFMVLAPKVALDLPYPRDKKLLRITEALLADPSEQRTLVDWQREVGASARTLARLFKQQTGLSYSQWLQRLRLQVAIQMLSRGESVLTTALSLGYASGSAFGYMFRQLMGVAPSQYLLAQNTLPKIQCPKYSSKQPHIKSHVASQCER
ncbi:AraC family transcriptional regulator [Shewanella oncorhynchi]|uniref:AraC family transcriptional regulator n=1 Tax=Shewanella oncorhynchi TaxID=2726434 RepID=UPI0037465931